VTQGVKNMPVESTKRPKKRKTRKRAVLQFRIPQAKYRELAKAAAEQDLTISELAASRLLAYPKLEQDAEHSERILDRALLMANVDEELEKRDRKIVLRLGRSELGISLLSSSQLEELLVKAAKMGAELALKDFEIKLNAVKLPSERL
jgi:hypothetical protein